MNGMKSEREDVEEGGGVEVCIIKPSRHSTAKSRIT
jgi:hypothetical protein